jgi:hypothetical protein
MKTKSNNSDTLKSFTHFCEKHPSMRFWQALLSWSNAEFILAVGLVGHTRYKAQDEIQIFNHDTFYWNGRRDSYR